MKSKEKRTNSILRITLVGISILLQTLWILLRILQLRQYNAYISGFMAVISLLVVLRIYAQHKSPAMKLPWILLILVFPVMGISLHFMVGLSENLGRAKKRLVQYRKTTRLQLSEDPWLRKELSCKHAAAANLSAYLSGYAHAPLYDNTRVTYYAEATDAFEALKEALRKAEKYIYMEYFIVQDDVAFSQIRQILKERADAGVDVRLMYDDIGSIGYASFRFARELRESGIHCRVFNPVRPVLSLFMNYRDHRKITVIDGVVGFTGGYNLANEYFDMAWPYGKWKDTGLRLEGEAVRSLTMLFLEMWHMCGGAAGMPVFPEKTEISGADALVQPFGDAPVDPERVAENVYLNMIASATQSLWIMTPYLIISDEMVNALGLAAKRGVDVRIITPGIPDKKLVYQVTRSYYAGLSGQGVRIFEYVPGFCHAKQCLCDGKIASIGTSNLDFRSLYHHFENNVVLYGGSAVAQMEKDFLDTFSQCAEVTDRYRTGRKAFLRTWQCLLRLFAPLI